MSEQALPSNAELAQANRDELERLKRDRDRLIEVCQEILIYPDNETPLRPGALVWDDLRSAIKACEAP